MDPRSPQGKKAFFRLDLHGFGQITVIPRDGHKIFIKYYRKMVLTSWEICGIIIY